MKIVMAIVSNDDSSSVSAALTKENFSVTRLATTGGFLRSGNTTIIVGTDDEKVEKVIEIIGNESKRRT
ncbi:MAG: transcriptional regulator, partial [Erysipelothrix sp.]|nr:transcriptional regulator [Erysipelothrix sp.]